MLSRNAPLGINVGMASRFSQGGGIPGWVPNRANPPDIAVNWTTNQAWLKSTGLTSPALLGITTSRASVKQVVDSLGNWSQVAANVTAQSNLGRSTEEARTNSIRNNTMQGAVVCADNVEHLTNGNFASAGAGWSFGTAGAGSVVFSTGSVALTGDGTTNNNYIAQQISGLVVGRNYVVSIATSTAFNGQLQVGTVVQGQSVLAIANILGNGSGSAVSDRLGFTATATSHWITLSHTTTSTMLITSLSVQDGERAENGGFTANPLNAAQGTVQNGWEWSNNAGTGTVTWNGSNSVTATGDGTHAAVVGTLALPTVAGFTYIVTYDQSGSAATLVIGSSALSNQIATITTTLGTAQKAQFTATGSTTFVSFTKTSAVAATIANVSVQSAGAMPTNWTISNGGFSTQVVGVGTINGIDYIDVRFFGVNTSQFPSVIIDGLNGITTGVGYGQTWTASGFDARVAAVDVANVSSQNVQITIGSGSFRATAYNGNLTSNLVRGSGSFTINNSADTSIAIKYQITMAAASGLTMDQTIRIGWPQLENNSLINSTVASATVAAGGTTGVTGTAVYSVGGGTGTAATLNVTVSGGAITAINSVASAGSYTVFPPSPAALTYVSGTGSGVVGATVNLTPTNLAGNAFTTSPIKTTSAAATRAADVTTLTGQTFGSAYTLYEQATPQAPGGYSTNQVYLSANDGGNGNRFQVHRAGNGTGVTSEFMASAGVSQTTGPNPANALAQNVSGKSAAIASATQTQVALNGLQGVAGGAVTLPTISQINFGSRGNGDSQLNGLAAIDAIWLSQSVPQAQLVSMTA